MKSVLEKRIHCVGAGGAGMLPLAICLSQKGHDVSAEDDSLTEEQREMLETAGIAVGAFSAGDSIGALVRSSAIGLAHSSVEMALGKGWKVMRRGECLAKIAKEKKLIAVVGSHGKTTTTGMLIDLCERMGQEVSYMLGANFVDGSSSGRWNNHEYLVAEIDESDRTIDGFEPEVTLWLNTDHDHHSQYETEEAYRSVFVEIVSRTKSLALIRIAEESVAADAEVIAVGEGGVWTHSRNEKGNLIVSKGGIRHEVALNVEGDFNDSNFTFAFAAFEEVFGIPESFSRIDFRSIQRRQSCRYISPLIRVLDDYAHHPNEIRALLQSMKGANERKRVTIFQPHRFSRTARLKNEIAASLAGCGKLFLIDIYAASEASIQGGGIDDLAKCFGGEIAVEVFRGTDDALFDRLGAESNGGVVDFLFIGAGRTDQMAKAFAHKIAARDEKWGALYLNFAGAGSFSSSLRAMEPMARKTTLRVGGAAELYCEPRSLGELQALLRTCSKERLPLRVLGRGSNLIVPDTGVPGLVIRLQDAFWKSYERLDGRLLRVGAGMRIKELCGLACRLEMPGFEFLEGIPGNLGGALRMNAGAMGGWMFDVVERVTYVTMQGEIVERSADDIHVGYRFCAELRDAIAVEAVLKSNTEERAQDEIRSAIDVYQGKRKESQPREPSAGCIFKNPEGDSAGRLIDELGLKGTSIGGARFSEVHGNFIVNAGGASSEDVIDLVKLARRVAWREKQIDLEPEALLYGASWKEVLS